MKDKRIVQVNDAPTEIGRNHIPDAALVADAGLTADNIRYWLDEAEIAPTGFTAELEGEALTAHPPARSATSRGGYLDFVHALDRLEEALPRQRVLTTDGGRFMTEVWCRVSVPDPRSFIVTANFGSIGLGLQEAIGAGLARPDTPLVHFTGDGGFMMGGVNEFNTAIRLKQDLIVVVCNDSAYGAEHIQFIDRRMDPSLAQFDWPSFSEVARALGGEGVTVQTPEDLARAVEAVESRKGPLLIELRLDPEDVPRMRT